jgi:hypothetical protein
MIALAFEDTFDRTHVRNITVGGDSAKKMSNKGSIGVSSLKGHTDPRMTSASAALADCSR